MEICRCVKLKSKEEISRMGYSFPDLDDELGNIIPIYLNSGREMAFLPKNNLFFSYYEYLSDEEYSAEECMKIRPQFFI